MQAQCTKKREILIQFITKNIEGRITTRQLAREVSMSLYHFARRFKEFTGVTPGQFITRMRVDCAKPKLATDLSICAIAASCGFSNQSHMTRVFKIQTGTTPGKYRVKLTSRE